MRTLILSFLCICNFCFAFDYVKQDQQFWIDHLKPEVYAICRLSDTELPGSGKYDNFFVAGTYYCACCGGDFPLYSSKTKFDSHTGWPSFYEPLPNAIITRPDPNDTMLKMLGAERIEVLCARCESHLGHVFDDGPPPTNKRYCMNSLALVFVPEGKKPFRTYEVKITPKDKMTSRIDQSQNISQSIIIDVRTPKEFASNSNPASINLPLDELESKLETLNKEMTIIVCCASGRRSALAAAILKQHGFKNVRDAGSWRNTVN